jgi:hypothetical protein
MKIVISGKTNKQFEKEMKELLLQIKNIDNISNNNINANIID